MTREEMIDKLKKLDFVYLWPGKISEDLIGFTEHPIWLNKEGYGYFACDESNEIRAVKSVSNEKWLVIREKISTGTISYDDIKGTSLELVFEYEDEFIRDDYIKLLDLPVELGDYIYWYGTFDGLEFFADEESGMDYFRRDYCEVEWDSLTDEELKAWIENLEDENFESDSPIAYV